MNQKYVSEFIGTTFLLMIVVGSGIMGERLAGGNEAIALLANSLATGAGLFVLIQRLAPISGAHMNPAVSFTEMLWGRITKNDFIFYSIAQISGAFVGTMLSHSIFDLDILQISTKNRRALNLGVSEFIATFGLIIVIATAGKKHVEWIPAAIAAYIASAYWFTSSTSFANPAVTIARSFTNTFCGISPQGVLPFILTQILGSVAAFILLQKLRPQNTNSK